MIGSICLKSSLLKQKSYLSQSKERRQDGRNFLGPYTIHKCFVSMKMVLKRKINIGRLKVYKKRKHEKRDEVETGDEEVFFRKKCRVEESEKKQRGM